MADSAVPVSGGSGYNVDTFTQSNGDHRQAMVVGDANGAQTQIVDSSGRAAVAASGLSVPTPAIVSMTSGTTYVVPASSGGNITFWIQGTNSTTTAAVTIGTIVFEQSDDGTNWAPLSVVRSDNSIVVQSVAGGTIAAGAALALDAALEGINFVRARATSNASSGTQYLHAVVGGMPFSPVVSVAAGAITSTATSITKGTQGTTGYTVQPLRDAGRLIFSYYASQAAGVTTEALLSGTTQKGATQATAVTAPAVTSGKTLRITSLDVSLRSGAAAVAWSRFALRTSFTSTAVTASSPILAQIELITGSATSGIGDRAHLDFPDGIELGSTVSFGLTHIGSATTNIEAFSLTGFEY